MLKFAIGLTEDDRRVEFGEVFHVGAAMLFRDDIEAYVVGDDRKEVLDLYEFLLSLPKADSRVHKITREEYKEKYKDKFFTVLNKSSEEITKHYDQKAQYLTDAFLKDSERFKDEIKDYLCSKKIMIKGLKALVWIRKVTYDPERNITLCAIGQIKNLITDIGIIPIFIGSKFEDEAFSLTHLDSNLIEFWKDSPFQSDCIKKQLLMFQLLREEYNVLSAIGMMSGSIDGPAFLDMPTIFFARGKDAKRILSLASVIKSLKHIPVEFNEKFERLSITELENLKKELENLKII